MLSWYEATLPPGERKTRGHFSTPPLLVEQILDACGYTSEHDLSSLRVLDPACGSANFLAGALRRLVASEKQHKRLKVTLQRNIWGVDPDPVACLLAEMQLRAVLMSYMPQMARLPLHIHQADGLALPWEQCQNVDLFLANPPYLASKNNDLSGYRSARGQTDSYLLFLRLALQVVRPGGWMGLVLPDPVLARNNAARERQRLLSETTVHQLWHLAGVFSAQVGAVVIVAQKKLPPRYHQISWVRGKWRTLDCPQAIAQGLLANQPGSELRYLLSEVRGSLVARLCTHHDHVTRLMQLREVVSIRRGEELSKESPSLSTNPIDGQVCYPVLRGGVDVQPYGVPAGQRWIVRSRVSKPLANYLAPKLLVVKSTGRLQATLDLGKHVVLQTLYLLRLHSMDSPADDGRLKQDQLDELYFLLALLNSRLLREYVYILHTAYKWVQPQIEQRILAELPIPIVGAEEKREIIKRAKQMMSACSPVPSVVELKESTQLYEEQECSICKLYETALLPSD